MAKMLAAEARLAAVALAQRGVFTRVQALAAGFGAGQLERRVQVQVWRRVLPHVYRHAGTPLSNVGRYWAAVLWAGPGCALSHSSAAAIWGIGYGAADRPELIVPKGRGPRSGAVVVHRVTRIGRGDVLHVRDLPVTSPARTIVDLAGVLTERDLEVVLDGAMSRGLVTLRTVRVRLDEPGTAGRPGRARLAKVLAAFGSGAVESSARMAG